MTRFGFLVFNILLMTVIYGGIYLNNPNQTAINATVAYTVRQFCEPYGALLFIMTLLSSIRWFWTHDTEVAKEIVTLANAFWIFIVGTIFGFYLLGTVDAKFWHGLHGLMTLR